MLALADTEESMTLLVLVTHQLLLPIDERRGKKWCCFFSYQIARPAEVVVTSVVIESILVSVEFAVEKGCLVTAVVQRHRLLPHRSWFLR
jgi:hypothetical protein